MLKTKWDRWDALVEQFTQEHPEKTKQNKKQKKNYRKRNGYSHEVISQLIDADLQKECIS